jgi:kindlin 2
VTPDVNLSHGKYNIRLNTPSKDGMTEMWIRPDSEDQYARWLAAFRLASKGRTMADSSYDTEVKTIHELLHMQHPDPSMALSLNEVTVVPENLLAARYLKKLKSKQSLVQRILEAHAHVQDKSLTEAKMSYIKAWQALPEHGITYFIVKFKGAKKDVRITLYSVYFKCYGFNKIYYMGACF